MLNKLRAHGDMAYITPPAPMKMKPSIQDFRKFTPKIVQKATAQVAQRQQPRLIGRQPLPLIPPVIKPISKPPNQQIPSHTYRGISTPQQKVSMQPIQTNIQHYMSQAAAQRVSSPIRKQPVIIRMPSPVVREPGIGNISDLRNIGNNRVLVMIAAGPSVKEIDFKPIKNHPKIDFMCINQPCEAVWPAKYWAFCDQTQYKRNVAVWDKYSGIVINSANVTARRPKQFIIGSRSGKGFSTDITKGYHIGRSSTYANMQVAYFIGYDKIYLCGVDMAAAPDGTLHYYGQNPDVTNERRKERFAIEAESYLWAGKNLPKEIKEKFVFCSSWNPWPFMELFHRLGHAVMVEEILKYVKNMG